MSKNLHQQNKQPRQPFPWQPVPGRPVGSETDIQTSFNDFRQWWSSSGVTADSEDLLGHVLLKRVSCLSFVLSSLFSQLRSEFNRILTRPRLKNPAELFQVRGLRTSHFVNNITINWGKAETKTGHTWITNDVTNLLSEERLCSAWNQFIVSLQDVKKNSQKSSCSGAELSNASGGAQYFWLAE